MKVLSTYSVESEGVVAEVSILDVESEFTNIYALRLTKIRPSTQAVMDFLKQKVIEGVNLKAADVSDPSHWDIIRERVRQSARVLLRSEFGSLGAREENLLVGRLLQDMLGLGEMEFLLVDEALEEIVVNSSQEEVWVYHRKFGWLKTNVLIPSEDQIRNYASIMGRRVGKQITTLEPLMDAYLMSGHRVNATLAPISAKGNSITIRKFRKDPFTVIDFIDPALKTLSVESAALLWLSVQYEMNVLIGGGTASGKTSFLNAILAFTPPNQRVVSIEDTRELLLPTFLHWTPMVTRLPNSEGKGEVSMLDLAVNSLRMRPDRIVLGEVRRQREAEVLFEAMHTGHSVYATLHADDAQQVKNRLINPPIALPEQLLSALHLIVVQYRQRRSGIRRTIEMAEVIPEDNGVSLNMVFRWDPRADALERVGEHIRLDNEITNRTGLRGKEIAKDLGEKQLILTAMLEADIRKVDAVGRVFARYYKDPASVVEAAAKGPAGMKSLLAER